MREKESGLKIHSSEKIKVRMVLLFGESQLLFISHQSKRVFDFFSLVWSEDIVLYIAYIGRVKEVSLLHVKQKITSI